MHTIVRMPTALSLWWQEGSCVTAFWIAQGLRAGLEGGQTALLSLLGSRKGVLIILTASLCGSRLLLQPSQRQCSFDCFSVCLHMVTLACEQSSVEYLRVQQLKRLSLHSLWSHHLWTASRCRSSPSSCRSAPKPATPVQALGRVQHLHLQIAKAVPTSRCRSALKPLL